MYMYYLSQYIIHLEPILSTLQATISYQNLRKIQECALYFHLIANNINKQTYFGTQKVSVKLY